MNWTKIKSVLVTGLLMGLVGVCLYITKLGNIFQIDLHSVANIFALAVVGVIGSAVQELLTTRKGKFLGVVRTREPF